MGNKTARYYSVAGAARAFEGVGVGCSVFVVCQGQFSLVDVLDVVVGAAGDGCRVDLGTWAAADEDGRRLCGLLDRGQIGEFRMVCGLFMLRRNPEMVRAILNRRPDGIRAIRNHCKAAAVYGSDGSEYFIRSSANLNANRQLEFFELSEGDGLARYWSGIVDCVFGGESAPSLAEIAEAMESEPAPRGLEWL